MKTAKFSLVLFLILLHFAVCQKLGAEVSFVFVSPCSEDAAVVPVDLPHVKIVSTTSNGRAFLFRETEPSDSSVVQSVNSELNKSLAVKKALELWDAARKAAPAPGQQWIQSDGPVPVWVLDGSSPGQGPGIFSLLPIRIQRKNGYFNSSQLIILDRLKTARDRYISIDEMISSGLLIQMVCHEIFHGIMADLYRERFLYFNIQTMFMGGPHDLPTETDSYLAFKEGFAEAAELWFSRNFPAEFAPRKLPENICNEAKAMILRLSQKRLKMLEFNRCIFEANGQIKDGVLKNGAKNISTEGVIGSLIFTIINNANLSDSMIKTFTVLANAAPTSFFEFAAEFMRSFPDRTNTIRRILLEYTNYTIFSNDAAALYEKYYLAKKSFVMGKLSRQEFLNAKNNWNNWKKEQLEKVNKGADVNNALPQPFVVITREGYSVDLNDEDQARLAWHLEAFIPKNTPNVTKAAEFYAAKILQKRNEIRVFQSVNQLKGVVPEWLFNKISAGFKRNLSRIEKSLDSEISKRRTLTSF
ncbi:MAG: hypothetical protein HQM10_18765 [Candidatus Riflebacteria bacterium]|nr:hypothetical protein [Candidatus Riflebacteria bacterium]